MYLDNLKRFVEMYATGTHLPEALYKCNFIIIINFERGKENCPRTGRYHKY